MAQVHPNLQNRGASPDSNGHGVDAQNQSVAQRRHKKGLGFIDCDVHEMLKSNKDLAPYLPDVWKKPILEDNYNGPRLTYFTGAGTFRKESRPPGGGPGGS